MSRAAEVVSILGGGWSARGYDRDRLPGLVIGVNDSALLARCDYAVSMDRLWTEHRWELLRLQCDRGELNMAYIRRAALANIPIRPPWLHPFENDHTHVKFAAQGTGRLNGTNSGACAINLALNLSPARVILFGFDMNRGPAGEAYWFPPYPWAKAQGNTSDRTYGTWAREFALIAQQFAARGVDVINASPGSAITAFRKADPKDLLT